MYKLYESFNLSLAFPNYKHISRITDTKKDRSDGTPISPFLIQDFLGVSQITNV